MRRHDDRAKLRGHAASERTARLNKARKIEHLLGVPLAGKEMLDLGTGAGVIAEYFHSRGAIVTAADRDVSHYQFMAIDPVEIEGVSLPFGNESFDVIIFNHVIEHIGDRLAQKAMLVEIERCLRPGGVLYLAVPNKWAMIEPHYKIPLLGAMPRSLANWLVRVSEKHTFYDCYPFNRSALQLMLGECFAVTQDVSRQAYTYVVENEIGGAKAILFALIPLTFIKMLSPVYPTLIFTARKNQPV